MLFFPLRPHILKKIVIDETTREANLVHNTHPTHGKTESELLKPRLKKKKKKKRKKKKRNPEEIETPDTSFQIKTKNTRGSSFSDY